MGGFLQLAPPRPSPEKQREIVAEYETVVKRIALNEKLGRKLEETAQAIYKHWFVDFEFPMSAEDARKLGKPELEGKPYRSSGGEMLFDDVLQKEIPTRWIYGPFGKVCKITMGQSPKGETYNTYGNGVALINGPVEFDSYFTAIRKWTTEPTKLCKTGDLIICVRGSTTGKFVRSNGAFCLGRGVCSLRAIQSQNFVDYTYLSIRGELLSFTTGSTFPNWSSDEIANFPIIIPDIADIQSFDININPLIRFMLNRFRELNLLESIQTLILKTMSKV